MSEIKRWNIIEHGVVLYIRTRKVKMRDKDRDIPKLGHT